MKTAIAKVKCFEVGNACYFYDYQGNFIFWKASAELRTNPKKVKDCGFVFEVEYFKDKKLKEEYFRDIGKLIKPISFSMAAKEDLLHLSLFVRGEIIPYHKAKIDLGSEVNDTNKFSLFAGIFHFLDTFFKKDINCEMIEVEFENVEALIDSLSELPAVKVERIKKEVSSTRWYFHRKFGFFAEFDGRLSGSVLLLDAKKK